MPRPEPPARPARRLSRELAQEAGFLRQRSRFLLRRTRRLLDHSNDLLTIFLFRRESAAPRPPASRPTLVLIS